MNFDINDSRTLKRCQGYMTKFFGDELVRTRAFTNHHRLLNTSDLTWNARSIDTYVWCKHYIKEHTGQWQGGSNSVKQQSKRKNFKLRKVSKKY